MVFAASKCQRCILEGDKTHAGDSYALCSGAHRLGNGDRDQTLGGSCSGLERGSGVAGIGHRQIRPKRGKFFVYAGLVEMVRRQGIRSPKLFSHFLACGPGAGGITEVIKGCTLRRHQCTSTRTTRSARERTCNSGGRIWSGRHDRLLHSK